MAGLLTGLHGAVDHQPLEKRAAATACWVLCAAPHSLIASETRFAPWPWAHGPLPRPGHAPRPHCAGRRLSSLQRDSICQHCLLSVGDAIHARDRHLRSSLLHHTACHARPAAAAPRIPCTPSCSRASCRQRCPPEPPAKRSQVFLGLRHVFGSRDGHRTLQGRSIPAADVRA